MLDADIQQGYIIWGGGGGKSLPKLKTGKNLEGGLHKKKGRGREKERKRRRKVKKLKKGKERKKKKNGVRVLKGGKYLKFVSLFMNIYE